MSPTRTVPTSGARRAIRWDIEKDLRLLERAIALDPTQPRFYRALATVLAYLGHDAEARQAMAQYRHMVRGDADP